MKKIVKMIIKSNQIKKRFLDKVNSQIKMIQKDKKKHEDHLEEEDELDDHNDSSNWSYA